MPGGTCSPGSARSARRDPHVSRARAADPVRAGVPRRAEPIRSTGTGGGSRLGGVDQERPFPEPISISTARRAEHHAQSSGRGARARGAWGSHSDGPGSAARSSAPTNSSIVDRALRVSGRRPAIASATSATMRLIEGAPSVNNSAPDRTNDDRPSCSRCAEVDEKPLRRAPTTTRHSAARGSRASSGKSPSIRHKTVPPLSPRTAHTPLDDPRYKRRMGFRERRGHREPRSRAQGSVKTVQMQGARRGDSERRGHPRSGSLYAAGRHEERNAADGPFSATPIGDLFAAVHADDISGDPGGLRPRERHQRAGHVLGRRQPPVRVALGGRLHHHGRSGNLP